MHGRDQRPARVRARRRRLEGLRRRARGRRLCQAGQGRVEEDQRRRRDRPARRRCRSVRRQMRCRLNVSDGRATTCTYGRRATLSVEWRRRRSCSLSLFYRRSLALLITTTIVSIRSRCEPDSIPQCLSTDAARLTNAATPSAGSQVRLSHTAVCPLGVPAEFRLKFATIDAAHCLYESVRANCAQAERARPIVIVPRTSWRSSLSRALKRSRQKWRHSSAFSGSVQTIVGPFSC